MKFKVAMMLCLSFILLGGAPGQAQAERGQETFARFGAVRIAGDGPSHLNLGLGVFDTFDEHESFFGHVEWRSGDKLGFVGPLAGILANVDGAAMAYVGLHGDISIGRFVITPQTGFGAYEEGDSRDLGGVFEFISGMTLSWRLDNDFLLGARWEHISNLGLHEKNPGSNMILLNLGLPF